MRTRSSTVVMRKTLLCSAVAAYLVCVGVTSAATVNEDCCGNNSTACGFNQVYDTCFNPKCPGRTCDDIGKLYKCSVVECEAGCRCKDGYYSNEAGQCISEKECGKCPENQVWDLCPTGCPPRTCNTSNIAVRCISPPEPGDPACKPPACRCKEGFFTNDHGDCVPKEECPPVKEKPQCGFNQVFDTCFDPDCPGRTCDDIGKQYNCPRAKCETGCRCKDGYFTNDAGQCISQRECGKCPVNQVWDLCPTTCPPRTCALSDALVKCVAPPLPGDPSCKPPKCRCKNGFYSNGNGECITRDECHGCTRPKEIWDPFAPETNKQTCDNIKEYECYSERRKRSSRCKGKCVCEEGYYRNYLRECILKEDCLRCTGPHEYYSCGGACDNVCSTLSTQNQTNCPIINIKCNEMCYCEKGYARNAHKICVPFDQCEKENVLRRKVQKTRHRKSVANSGSTCSSNDVEAGKQQFTDGSNAFTANFYAELSKEIGHESSIMSPYSLLFLLAQLYLYATGKTFDQLGAALNLNSKDLARCVFPPLINEINSETDVQFTLATKTYATDADPLSDAFKKDTKEVFQAEAQSLDFSDSVGSAKIINNWVADKTENKITNIISSDALNSDTVAVLVNALYFRGLWQQPFNEKNTYEADFYKSSVSTSKVQLMYVQKGKFLYGTSDNLDCKILSMPYGNSGEFSFWIFLPNNVDGLPALQEKMRNINIVEEAVKNTNNVTINVYIPKMKVETSINLKTLLPKLDVTEIFNSGNSGLEGILANQNGRNVYVTDAIQKAIIEVTEEGTVAAAANAIVVGVTSVIIEEPPLEFRADRSFTFQIRNKNVVVFTGSYLGD